MLDILSAQQLKKRKECYWTVKLKASSTVSVLRNNFRTGRRTDRYMNKLPEDEKRSENGALEVTLA